jgi:hypothetical protein
MLLLVFAWFGSGCKRVTGERVVNQAPLVWFANVPPENQRFSTNPLVHWVGQDRDGQVVSYRYRIIRQTTMMAAIGRDTLSLPDSAAVDEYIALLLNSSPDSVWTYLHVNPQEGNPQTGVTIPLVAELRDPVRVYVPQYVFVQAIDNEGLTSNVAFRRFVRNNNPPSTRIFGFDSSATPYIDAPVAGGVATGIRLMWVASDIIDYPTDAPPFEFQWRLYGPYDSAFFKDSLEFKFRKVAFITNDARVFIKDHHDTLRFCDTAYYGPDMVETCDTLLVDTVTAANLYGRLDTILNIDDPEFANDSMYNWIADSSWDSIRTTSWVLNTRDSLYDAFRRRLSPVTQQARFIFWVRSRDDARGPDVTPAFISFTVVAPKYEHTLLIADADISFDINKRNKARAKLYWQAMYKQWNHGDSTGFDLTRDYATISQASGNVLTLFQLLSHKMVVFVSDDVHGSLFKDPVIVNRVFTALDAGVSLWMCGRTMILGGEGKPPEKTRYGDALFPIDKINPNPLRNYLFYFGVEAYQFTGWQWFALKDPPTRIEDFIGTASLKTSRWPDMVVDTSRLRVWYSWTPDLPYQPNIGALPEVGYMESTFGTEVMHLYKSKFKAQALPQPLNQSFDGRPVMHRLNRGFYRSAVSLFTPYAMAPYIVDSSVNPPDTLPGADATVLEMLDWMYQPFQAGVPGTASFYFPDGPAAVSLDQARAIHWQEPQEDGRPLGSEF